MSRLIGETACAEWPYEYYFYLDPDGCWIMNEYRNMGGETHWEKSIIGVNEKKGWC